MLPPCQPRSDYNLPSSPSPIATAPSQHHALRPPPIATPAPTISPTHSASIGSADGTGTFLLKTPHLQDRPPQSPSSPLCRASMERSEGGPRLQTPPHLPHQPLLGSTPRHLVAASPVSEIELSRACSAVAPLRLPASPRAHAAVPVEVTGMWRRGGVTLGVLRRIAAEPRLQLLSFWWAAVYGPVFIFAESYITNVYEQVDAGQDYNGHVDAAAALARIAGALCAPLLQPLAAKRPGVAHGAWLAGAAACIAAIAGAGSLFAVYAWYIAAVALLQLQLCVVQAESAAAVAGEYTALFGLNQLATLLLQAAFQVRALVAADTRAPRIG